VPLPGYREQFMAQSLPGTAPGLDRVAVGAQRDHLLWVVRAALGEILDVVYIQDGRPASVMSCGSPVRLLTRLTCSHLASLHVLWQVPGAQRGGTGG
jgi:hypothetical protein